MKPEQYLMVLVALLNRLAMNDAEKLGAQACVEGIKKGMDELEEIRRNESDKAREKIPQKNGNN